jgi:hypothetical protein
MGLNHKSLTSETSDIIRIKNEHYEWFYVQKFQSLDEMELFLERQNAKMSTMKRKTLSE